MKLKAVTAVLALLPILGSEASLVLAITGNANGNARFEFSGSGVASTSTGYKANYVPVGNAAGQSGLHALALPFELEADGAQTSTAAVSMGASSASGYLMIVTPWLESLDGGESVSLSGRADTPYAFSDFEPGSYTYQHRSGLNLGEALEVVVSSGGLSPAPAQQPGPQAIPEPSSFAMALLLALGGIGVAVHRLRRLKKSGSPQSVD